MKDDEKRAADRPRHGREIDAIRFVEASPVLDDAAKIMRHGGDLEI